MIFGFCHFLFIKFESIIIIIIIIIIIYLLNNNMINSELHSEAGQ